MLFIPFSSSYCWAVIVLNRLLKPLIPLFSICRLYPGCSLLLFPEWIYLNHLFYSDIFSTLFRLGLFPFIFSPDFFIFYMPFSSNAHPLELFARKVVSIYTMFLIYSLHLFLYKIALCILFSKISPLIRLSTLLSKQDTFLYFLL